MRDGHVVMLEREIGSGKETEVFRTETGGLGVLKLSPDGLFVGTIRTDPASKATTLEILPISGGAAKPLLRAASPEELTWQWHWTGDSQAVIVRKSVPNAEHGEMWLAPLTGSPRKLDIDMSRWVEGGHAQIHPDGRQIAFVATAGQPGAEVWALENFLPVRSLSRK
jgi:hypothetical protein